MTEDLQGDSDEMIHKQREEIVVMRKYFSVLLLSVVFIGGLLGSASAMQYSVSVAMFPDAFTFATNPTPKTLILVFGKPDPFLSAVDNMPEFSIRVGDSSDQIEVIAKEALQLMILEDTSFDMIAQNTILGLVYQDVQIGDSLSFKVEDLLVFKKASAAEIWTLEVTIIDDTYGGLTVTTAIIATPEPSTLIFLGLGLISMIGIVRWKKRRRWNWRK